MQESCRWIIHFDIPWSPSKLQQRNGRVSRHGQVRNVSVHYFRCDQEEDMDFLFRVAEKVEQVREDLGSVERVFDAAIHRHFQGKTTPDEQLTLMLKDEIARSPERRELGQASGDKIASLTAPCEGTAGIDRQPPGHLAGGLAGDPGDRPRRSRVRGRWKRSRTGPGSTVSSRRPAGPRWSSNRSRSERVTTAWRLSSTPDTSRKTIRGRPSCG